MESCVSLGSFLGCFSYLAAFLTFESKNSFFYLLLRPDCNPFSKKYIRFNVVSGNRLCMLLVYGIGIGSHHMEGHLSLDFCVASACVHHGQGFHRYLVRSTGEAFFGVDSRLD